MKNAYIGVFLAGVFGIATHANALDLELDPKVQKELEFTNCKNDGGTWQCIVKNKSDMGTGLVLYHATSYDRNGVRIKDAILDGKIEPNGSTYVRFVYLGYAGDVAKIVIKKRF
jgi:hypothetical protein